MLLLRELKQKEYKLRNYDFKLIFFVMLVSIAGLIVVKSATSGIPVEGSLSIYQKQILGMVVGLVAMVIVSFMDYHFLQKLAPLWYLFNVAMLAYLYFFVSYNLNNARRWIPLGPITIQPSELSKIIMVIVVSAYLAKFRKWINHPVMLGGLILLAAPSLVLILKQPALSATLVHVFIIVIMIYVAGISYKWVAGVLGAGIAGVGVLWMMIHQEGQVLLNKVFKAHQVERLNGFFFASAETADLNYQQDYSVMAIAGGQLHGKGLNNASFDSVKNGNFLSEEQSDFIWAVIGEELGFVGCCVIMALLALVIFEGLMIARRAKDLEGRLIAIGITAMFAFQTFVNIGVATKTLPNTGMQLPFISAGITSQISVFVAVGLLLNVGLQRKRNE